MNPISSKNTVLANITSLLRIANIDPLQTEVNDFQNEIKLVIYNSNGSEFPVFVSSTRNELDQITALQKIIKIAKIKGQDIKLVDLNLPHPYATLKNN